MTADQARFPPRRRSHLAPMLIFMAGLSAVTLLWLGMGFDRFPAWPGQPGGWHSLFTLLAFALVPGFARMPPLEVWAFDADARGLLILRDRTGPPLCLPWDRIDSLTSETFRRRFYVYCLVAYRQPDGTPATLRLTLSHAEGADIGPFVQMARDGAARGGFDLIGPPSDTRPFHGMNWRVRAAIPAAPLPAAPGA